jgi:hypothetical protein
MQIIFKEKGGVLRSIGFSNINYSSNAGETVVEATEGGLVAIFEKAKRDGETIDAPDKTIDDAIDDPLAFRDFLILVDGTIEFNPDHERQQPGQQ